MKLKQCIDIAEDCGLNTLGDAVLNVDIHAMSIFDYRKLSGELMELYKEYNDLYKSGLIDKDTSLEDAKLLIK